MGLCRTFVCLVGVGFHMCLNFEKLAFDLATPCIFQLFCTEYFDECRPNSVVYVFGGHEDTCNCDGVVTRGWKKLMSVIICSLVARCFSDPIME